MRGPNFWDGSRHIPVSQLLQYLRVAFALSLQHVNRIGLCCCAGSSGLHRAPPHRHQMIKTCRVCADQSQTSGELLSSLLSACQLLNATITPLRTLCIIALCALRITGRNQIGQVQKCPFVSTPLNLRSTSHRCGAQQSATSCRFAVVSATQVSICNSLQPATLFGLCLMSSIHRAQHSCTCMMACISIQSNDLANKGLFGVAT